jgi:hypothetical protein
MAADCRVIIPQIDELASCSCSFRISHARTHIHDDDHMTALFRKRARSNLFEATQWLPARANWLYIERGRVSTLAGANMRLDDVIDVPQLSD